MLSQKCSLLKNINKICRSWSGHVYSLPLLTAPPDSIATSKRIYITLPNSKHWLILITFAITLDYYHHNITLISIKLYLCLLKWITTMGTVTLNTLLITNEIYPPKSSSVSLDATHKVE